VPALKLHAVTKSAQQARRNREMDFIGKGLVK